MSKFFSILAVTVIAGLAIAVFVYVKGNSFAVMSTPRLTPAQANALIKTFASTVAKQNPGIALNDLRNLMETDRKVLGACHELVHEIGHAAYEKYGDFAKAVSFQDDLCGSGYLHGVIEAKFRQTTDVLAEMKTLCKNYASIVDLGKCYHGIGHGLMYYNGNNLPQAIEWCDSLYSTSAKIRCAEGVYMENFGSETSLHPSAFLNPKDSLYPCAVQPEQFKFACYYYAPLYYLNLRLDDYAGALKLCAGTELEFQPTCAKGVGSRAIKQNIHNTAFSEKICSSGTNEQVKPCLEGVVSYYLVNYNSMEKTKEMCNSLKKENRSFCISSAESQKNLIP